MEWALATRFQPQRDLVVMGDFRASPLDPSLAGAATCSKVGYDLTVPLGSAGIEIAEPDAPVVGASPFVSVRAALEDGPKYFRDLVAAAGSRDGRDVVLELEKLRAAGLLRRDAEEGRYSLAGAGG
jgi:3-polyprenyl-4-hydroxybenzoate decarboxylase